MNTLTIAAALSASLMFAGQAYALTLTNNESTTQDVVVIVGDAEKKMTIKPGEALEDLCSAACIVRLPDGSEYDLEPQDVIALEDGTLYVDAPSQGSGAPESESQEKKL